MLLHMARVVAALPEPTVTQRQQNADYAKYLDGQVWLIEDGDVAVPLHSLRATLVSQARRRGLKLKSRLGETLYVQALAN